MPPMLRHRTVQGQCSECFHLWRRHGVDGSCYEVCPVCAEDPPPPPPAPPFVWEAQPALDAAEAKLDALFPQRKKSAK